MESKPSKYDVCVVGGGMVGAAAALGLAKLGYEIALIEKNEIESFSKDQAPDVRISAFNLHSLQLLEELGALEHILKMRFKPYQALHVWENAQQKTKFNAQEVGVEYLGYFIENRLVQLALFEEIHANYSDKIYCFHGHSQMRIDATLGEVSLEGVKTTDQRDDKFIQANLVIGADGAQSQVRKQVGIATSGWQYDQIANVILIELPQASEPITWQQFFPSGPRAFLPMYGNYASLVWYDSKDRSDELIGLDYQTLKQEIISHFPPINDDFSVRNVARFPLTRMHAKRYGQDKAIILGDAAHTINPLAGQGVNLGFKDVASLLKNIEAQGVDHSESLISKIEADRKAANLLMMSTMDAIYYTFSNHIPPLRQIRQLGLKIAQNAGPIKRKALKYAMGL